MKSPIKSLERGLKKAGRAVSRTAKKVRKAVSNTAKKITHKKTHRHQKKRSGSQRRSIMTQRHLSPMKSRRGSVRRTNRFTSGDALATGGGVLGGALLGSRFGPVGALIGAGAGGLGGFGVKRAISPVKD